MPSQIFEYLVSLHLYWNIVPCLTVTPSMCKHRPVSLPEHSMYCTYIAAWFGRFRFLLVKASSLVYIWQKKRLLRRRRSRRRSLAFLTLCREDARGSYSRLLLLNKCDSDFQPFRYSVRFPKTLSPFLQLHFYSKALTWIWVRINILRAAKVEFHIFTTWKFQIPGMSA